jgi:hypothetical protein
MSDFPLAVYYRERAKRLREIAGSTGAQSAREELEMLAQQYDRMAIKIEGGILDKPPGKRAELQWLRCQALSRSIDDGRELGPLWSHRGSSG